MEIWPAIDIRGGKCVRLQQGDYQRETIFGEDPVAMGLKWVSEGAERLHLVDLDGARDGHVANRAVIERVVRSRSGAISRKTPSSPPAAWKSSI